MIPLFIQSLFLLVILSVGAWTVFVAGWLIGQIKTKNLTDDCDSAHAKKWAKRIIDCVNACRFNQVY